MENKVKSLVNTRNLFLIPIFVVFIVILVLGLISTSYSRNILKNKMVSDGIIIAQQFVDKIASSKITLRIIEENLEKRASEVGSFVLTNKNSVSNEYLKSISQTFDVDEIYFYTPEGKLIYSATETYIGWQAQEGDPIFEFMKSDMISFHEPIREGTETDEIYKFSYFKDSDGSFVQIGYFYNKYLDHVENYKLQPLIEDLSKPIDVMYVFITDNSLISIAHSDHDRIGVDLSDETAYLSTLSGSISTFESIYQKRNERILEVAVPLYNNDDITGILAYGVSLQPLNEELYVNLLRISTLLVLTGLILVFSQRQLVLIPLIKLRNKLDKFTLEDAIVRKLPVNSNDPFLGVVESFNSAIDAINTHVIEINRVNDELSYAANYDFVTGIRNRRSLMDYLSKISLEDEQIAICILDLNGLKDINDVYGHNTGDMYIKTIALRLSEFSEVFESFRFGGDEFFMVIKESGSNLNDILRHIVNRVSAPIEYNNETFQVRFCIGVSQSIQDGVSAEELIRKADIAMYNLKNQNEEGFRFYVESFNESIQFNEYVYKELVAAIETNGFKLLYQPIVGSSSQNVVSLEALLRLKNHPISPAVFIPVAESKGLIGKITYIVIDLVLNQMSTWRKSGYKLVPVAINISPKLFVLEELHDNITSKLRQYDIESQYLELEITEEVLIDNKDYVIEYLLKYRDIGIKVSLDDFGSGYSSLNYLTHIPFDKIKLDKTIIDRYLNQTNFKIIKSIIEIAHELGLPIVAEGVELQEQLDILCENDCDQVQGYLFSKPVTETIIEHNYLNTMKSN